MIEEWRDIKGTNGEHQVSSLGRVRSWIDRGRWRNRQAEPRLRSLYKTKFGHVAINIRSHTHMVHHLVLEAFVGPRPDGHMCRHMDNDPANNVVTNLRWGLSLDNNGVDKLRNGTLNRGERQGRSKLTRPQVDEIIRRYPLGITKTERRAMGLPTQAELGREYGVSGRCISLIVHKKNWDYTEADEKYEERRGND